MTAELPKNATPLLAKWNGGNAKLWSYSVSHRELVVRIEKEGLRGNLHLFCSPCISIRSPVYWEGCCLELLVAKQDDEDWATFTLLDKSHDVCILSRKISLREDVEPVF